MSILDDSVPTPVVPLARRAIRSLLVPRMAAQISLRATFRSEKVFVRDISAGGLGLISSRALDVGAELAIQFLAAPWSDLGALRATVIYVLPDRDREWRIGCRFLQSLNRKELTKLITEWADSLKYE